MTATKRLRACERCRKQAPKDRVDGHYLCKDCRKHMAEWIAEQEAIIAYHQRNPRNV